MSAAHKAVELTGGTRSGIARPHRGTLVVPRAELLVTCASSIWLSTLHQLVHNPSLPPLSRLDNRASFTLISYSAIVASPLKG